PRRALRGAAGGLTADRRRPARAGRRDDVGARARDAGPRPAARRLDGALRPARLRVPPGRRAPDELPPAALDAARARDGVRGSGGDAAPLPARDRGPLPLLLVRRRDADPVTKS